MTRLNTLITYTIFLFLSVVGAGTAQAAFPGSSERYLALLDSLIDNQQALRMAKQTRIAYFQNKMHNAVTDHDKYVAYSQIFDEYATFNADSALKYINLTIDIADRSDNLEWQTQARINKSNLLTATGLLKEAEEVMKSINRAKLPDPLLPEYYGQMIYLYSHLGNYAGGDKNEHYVRERAYKDSIMTILTPEHKDYLWYKGWDILGTDKKDSSLIPALLKKTDASRLDTRDDAKDFYILAKMYEWEGDRENFRKYMTLSAISDVKSANYDIASLEDLAKIMFGNGDGDIDRAYKYINYCLDKALLFPNRVRAFNVVRTQDRINQTYQERAKVQEGRIRLFLVILCILAAVLAATVVIIIMQNRKVKRQRENLDAANKELNNNLATLSDARKQLADANDRLTQLNDDLHRKNEELNEANYVKEEYIGYLFSICSSYIGKLDDFRKSIHVKAIARKYKEIEAATETHDTVKKELKDFYRSFDTVFLHIYPDFIADFNALLQADKQILPKEEELLNTELRIYALVRLGITDSVKIAEFLHCSPQTVYNNRFRVRNKAVVPKEEFADRVRTLGKFMDRPS